MDKPIKSKKHIFQVNKKRVPFPVTQGELKSVTSSKYFSSVVLDDSIEGHAFFDATNIEGIHDFTMCHMKIPCIFKYVPYAFNNGTIKTEKPIQLVKEDTNTLTFLNMGMPVMGHICATGTGNRADHGTAFCAVLARGTNQNDIILQKYSGFLNYPENKDGSLVVTAINGDYYLIPLVLSDKSTVYNAVLLKDNGNDVEYISEKEFLVKLQSWLAFLKTDPDFWKRIGVDRPVFPIWDDGLEIYVTSGMFIADKEVPIQQHPLI